MNARVAEIKIARAVPVESLKLHPRNPRTHAEPGSPIWEILRRSLEHAYFVSRSHAKVIALPTASGDHFVIEGSANLRSSDNTEQMVIFNDAEKLAWHRQWMAQLTPHANG